MAPPSKSSQKQRAQPQTVTLSIDTMDKDVWVWVLIGEECQAIARIVSVNKDSRMLRVQWAYDESYARDPEYSSQHPQLCRAKFGKEELLLTDHGAIISIHSVQDTAVVQERLISPQRRGRKSKIQGDAQESGAAGCDFWVARFYSFKAKEIVVLADMTEKDKDSIFLCDGKDEQTAQDEQIEPDEPNEQGPDNEQNDANDVEDVKETK